MGQNMNGKKVPNTRVVIVPVEEPKDSIMNMASEDNNEPESPYSPRTGRQSSIKSEAVKETDQAEQVQKKPTVKKKHFEAIRMKTAILKREKEEA